MAEPRRLSSAAKRQKMTSSKTSSAKKLADTSTPALAKSATSSEATIALEEIDLTVPGLMSLTPESAATSVPQFNHEAYNITDLYAPPESMPQATEAERNKLVGINTGAQFKLDIAESSLKTIEKVNVVKRQHAKTIGSGALVTS